MLIFYDLYMLFHCHCEAICKVNFETYKKYILYYYTIIVLILHYNIVCDHGMAIHFNTGLNTEVYWRIQSMDTCRKK